MRRMLSLAAAALAAAPAFAQTPPVQNRTQVQAPTAVQAGGQSGAGQGQGRTSGGQDEGRSGTRPIAGQSVPENQVGQATGGATGGQGQGRTGVGRSPTGAGGGMAGVDDRLFAAAAADGGLTEVTLSQLGAQRATDPELKQFSQQMLQEHTRMNSQLMTLTTQKGIRVPEMVDVRSQFCAHSLAGLSGAKFDECYAKAQLVVHMDSLAMFEAEAERGADPDMKALAAQAVPRIRAHLEMIKPIAKRYMKEGESAEHGRTGQPQPGGSPIR